MLGDILRLMVCKVSSEHRPIESPDIIYHVIWILHHVIPKIRVCVQNYTLACFGIFVGTLFTYTFNQTDNFRQSMTLTTFNTDIQYISNFEGFPSFPNCGKLSTTTDGSILLY